MLPPPRDPLPKKSSKRLPFIALFGLVAMVLWNITLPQQEILATIPFQKADVVSDSLAEKKALIEQKNHSLVTVLVNGEEHTRVSAKNLGISFSVIDSSQQVSLFQPSQAASSNDAQIQVSLDYKVWNEFLGTVRSSFERSEIKPHFVWDEVQGWSSVEGRPAVVIDHQAEKRKLERLIASLQQDRGAVLHLNTREVSELTEEARNRFESQSLALEALVREPLQLHIGNNIVELDLNKDRSFIDFSEGTASLNVKALKSWIDQFIAEHSLPASQVKIVGKEEIRAGVFKAVIDGEFKEGVRINADELFEQITAAFAGGGRIMKVKTYEIPVKVYSELEKTDYQLLSVGYSEYSTGNDANRVHNVKTGLERINGLLVDPGQNISFNRTVGTIDGAFKMGYGIFGSAALPVLGGGICQASTTFYRALLNLGIPITQRQNHSWDLSYYQSGGYGLDATIYPEKGLDVKAINDLPGQLLFYSYIRPETEEAFTLIYGKGDGRKVTLTPEKEYIPFKGAKTLRWKQTVEMTNGEVREYEIVSRYRA